jgi:hypothetical protein
MAMEEFITIFPTRLHELLIGGHPQMWGRIQWIYIIIKGAPLATPSSMRLTSPCGEPASH